MSLETKLFSLPFVKIPTAGFNTRPRPATVALPLMSPSSTPYQGVYTALVTPFRDDRVDEAAFTRLIEDQIAAGIDGVIPVGTTGESATLTMEQHLRGIHHAVQAVGR